MNKFRRLFSIYLFLIICFNLGAQQAFMVKDISTITLPSEPELLTRCGDYVYFYASDSIHGKELWRTDGTSSETVLVKDINPGKSDCFDSDSYWSYSYKPLSINDVLYFVANDGVMGNELWRTDGTEQGTYLIKEILTIPWDTPKYLTNYNDTLYFSTDTGLWKSDGTNSGTVKIKSISPSNMIVSNNLLFFTTEGYNSSLWKSNGTETGTVVVKEFNGYSVFSTSIFLAYNDKLYFTASENYYGEKLWNSDGTTAGTIQVLDNTGSYITLTQELVISNNTLFISGYDSIWQTVLRKSDGSQSSTETIYTFKDDYTGLLKGLIDINGTLFFQAKDSTVGNYNNEDSYLWKSDGTTEGTEVITSLLSTISKANLTCYDDNLYLCAFDSINGYELWKSDGTTEGTHIVNNICPGDNDAFPSYLTTLNDKLLFAANDREHGNELWMTDGIEEGTNLIKDINTIGDSYINGLTKVGDTLYFSARTEIAGQRLWISDGTNTGTNMITTPEELNISSPLYLTELNGDIYFYKKDDGLYKSDGTETGTSLVKPSFGKNMVCIEDTLYGDSRPGFWKSDGSTTGSYNITNNAYFNDIILVDSLLYLHSSIAIFISDGTESGTVLLKQFTSSYGIASINNEVYFSANDFDSTKCLFTTDGTVQGTVRVKEMLASNLTAVENTLFCSGSDNNNPDFELWKSNGTNSGTTLVKNINQSVSSNPMGLTNINGTLYFVADDGIHGYELWKSDGTDEGTTMILDINPGSRNSFTTNSDSTPIFVAIDTLVFFTANDGVNGWELWKTDGTETGTVLVNDINVVGDSYPKHLTRVGATLFFTAYEEVHGRELWAYGIPDIVCLVDGISFSNQADIDNFQNNYPGCKRIEGEVIITGDDINSLSSLSILNSFGENLIIGNTSELSDLSGLNNVLTIDGSLIIGGDEYGGNTLLTSLSGLNNLSSIQGDLIIGNNNSLTGLSGIENLNSVTITNLIITDNPTLSTCGISPVCEYLAYQYGTVIIENNAQGCDTEGQVNYACLVKVPEQFDDTPFTIYPNPATNNISVFSENGININELAIYNLHGQKVVFKIGTSDNIDISKLRHGIYIIELITEEKIYKEKIVIK